MPTTTGKFVWYDVMTTNTEAAETFYRGVIGWDAKDSGMPDRSYTLLSVGTPFAALTALVGDASGKTAMEPCLGAAIPTVVLMRR